VESVLTAWHERQIHEHLAQLVHARDRVAEPRELAAYCLHAVGAAGGLPSKAAVRRLVEVVLSGLNCAAR